MLKHLSFPNNFWYENYVVVWLQGVILYSMSDLALGFGVAAKATAECRHADPMQVVAFHQVNRSSLFWTSLLPTIRLPS